MIKRLERKKNVSEFVLTYYSIFLIITTLTGKYFPDYYDVLMSEYINIILSVVVLIYSIIIQKSNYSSRISHVMDSLNQLKSIKREISDETLEHCNVKYNNIVDRTERRSDTDFFITVKHLCREYDINWLTKRHNKKVAELIVQDEIDEYQKQEKVVNGYISEINVFVEEGKIVLEVLWEIILLLIPVALFAICLFSKKVRL